MSGYKLKRTIAPAPCRTSRGPGSGRIQSLSQFLQLPSFEYVKAYKGKDKGRGKIPWQRQAGFKSACSRGEECLNCLLKIIRAL